MDIKTLVDKRTHDYYWRDNINCTITTLDKKIGRK